MKKALLFGQSAIYAVFFIFLVVYLLTRFLIVQLVVVGVFAGSEPAGGHRGAL